MVKKLLESFIYRVEMLVQSHGIHGAYSTGLSIVVGINLKCFLFTIWHRNS